MDRLFIQSVSWPEVREAAEYGSSQEITR